MNSTVVLFDIDGTLIDCGGAGRRAIRAAFAREYGRPEACDAISFGGMTDRAIVRQGLEAIGVEASSRAIDRLLERYLELLPSEVAASAGYRVLPGARKAVATCVAAGFAVGLGTGNVRRGAMTKLAHGGLDGLFAFGGFGCDAEPRHELLRHGAMRGAATLGRAIDECVVLVVGDTPKDVHAARAIGAECIAVTTGPYGRGALEEAGARFVVASLEDDSTLALLRGFAQSTEDSRRDRSAQRL
jgi:phosphoglycolate phosphatase